MSDSVDRSPARVLVAMPNWLGDMVMATVLLERLTAMPDLEVHVLVRRRWLPLLSEDTRLARLHVYERTGRHSGWWTLPELAGRLRRQCFTDMFVLPPSLRFGVLAALTRIPVRVGYGGELRSLLLSPSLTRGRRGSRHYTEEIDRLWRLWHAQEDAPGMPMPALPGVRRIGTAVSVDDRPVWAVAVGSTYGDAKSWPTSRLAGFLELAVARDVRLLLLGDEAAREQSAALRETASVRWLTPEVSAAGVIDLVGATDLPTVTDILAKAELFVGNDSGLMHLAAALGTPTLGLFGSTNPAWTAPRGECVDFLTADGFACSPCHLRTCPEERFCMATIDAERVMNAAVGLIGRRG